MSEPANAPPAPAAPRTRPFEIAAALAVLGWRAASRPLGDLPGDALALLAAFAIAAAVLARKPALRPVTFVVMAVLLLLFARGQLPLSLAAMSGGK